MKTKMNLLNVLFVLFFSSAIKAQTIAVPDMSTTGLHTTPEIAAKLTRLELVKISKYTVLDEFDMNETLDLHPEFDNCYGKSCLIELGEALDVDYVLSGSIDGLGNKIVVSLKLIDVRNKNLKSTRSIEFDNQPLEIQRMIGITIQEMHQIQPNLETKSRLAFKNEVIVSNNVGKVNNSGPRIGVSYVAYGEFNEFFTRKESQGGLGIQPFMTNIGYQFEGQYVGTENFSALFEVILNVGGMEQGQFIPSITLMNGFRFGQSGWEFAFGPSFGIRKVSTGIFDEGRYYTKNDYKNYQYNNWKADTTNYNTATSEIYTPYIEASDDLFKTHLDNNGFVEFNASWIMGFGRTFKSGALNVPVNIYYSTNKFGGIFGASIGFNVIQSKKSIN